MGESKVRLIKVLMTRIEKQLKLKSIVRYQRIISDIISRKATSLF